MKKVTILIGEEYSPKVTLIYPECKLLPRDYIPLVQKHIQEFDEVVIRTCAGLIVDFVGELIYDEILEPDNVSIKMDGKTYHFVDEMQLGPDWVDGCLSEYEYDYVKF